MVARQVRVRCWASSEIGDDVRVGAGSFTGGAFTTMAPGATLTMTGQPDGPIHVDLRAHDPCRAEATHTVNLVLDTTPPVATYSQPALPQYATDQVTSIQYSVRDAGSGVASSSVMFDGAAATNGQMLDAFFLNAGLHTIVVTATDKIGNTGTTQRTFRVRATAASLLNNLDCARSLGLIPRPGAYNGAQAQFRAANKSHSKDKPTEWHQLGAFRNHLEAQKGKGIDGATAIRFIGYAGDLIAGGG